jgi:phosphatidylglycerol lysyltransferase
MGCLAGAAARQPGRGKELLVEGVIRRPDALRSNAGAARARRAKGHLPVLVLAALVAAMGCLNLWSGLLANGPGRVAFLRHTAHVPLIALYGSRSLIMLFGLGLIMVARSLARRKRQAWRMAVALLAVSPFLHLTKGLDWEEALLSIGMLAPLFLYRSAFWAANDRPSARQGALAALGLLGFAALYGPAGFLLLKRDFRPVVTPRLAAQQTAYLLAFGNAERALHARTHRAQWFEGSLPFLSAFSIGYAVFMLLRPVLARGGAGAAERATVRRLLTRWGGPPLSRFALLPDKRYLMDAEATTEPSLLSWAIAYVVKGRVAVALGDPIGDPDHAPEAVAAFLDFCAQHDWVPALYQVTPRHLDIYREMFQLKVLRVGEDPILDLGSFSLKGKTFQDVRTAMNKMGRAGILFEEWQAEHRESDNTLAQMADISEVWLRRHRGEEKTFALGRFDPESDLFRDSRVFIARSGEQDLGRVWGFVTCVPIYGPAGTVGGWALDLMRRRDEAPSGIMEFLIGSAALLFQGEGATGFSLGLSPLSEACPDTPDPAEDALLARGRSLLFERFNRYYSFKGLHAFKEKFCPQWEPRYLIYQTNATLAPTIYAVLKAHSPGGLRTFVMK